MNKITLVVFGWLLCSTSAFPQNKAYVTGMIDTLTSPGFYGRGYVNNADSIAAEFILKQLKKDNLTFFHGGAFQPFKLSVNTFPGMVALTINGALKTPGLDYMVMPETPTTNNSYKAIWLNEKTLSSPKRVKKFERKKLSNIAVVVDTGFKDLKNKKLQETPLRINIRDKGISWRVANHQNGKKQAEIIINRNALPDKMKKVAIDVEAKQLNDYQTQNVIGYIPGKVYPDSFVVFGAHYDHLGIMGTQTCFPGANDNASGTAMLLDLAAHYAKPENQPSYSVAFMFFSGEEAGLVGSDYYTEHPLFPLSRIKFMINLDMIGTGSEGIKVVNGSLLKPEFEKLRSLNEKGGYLKTVSERGEAANSDHYYFYKRGVKSFFIYTLGSEYKEYHTVNDKPPLPLTKYNELFKLVCDFVNDL